MPAAFDRSNSKDSISGKRIGLVERPRDGEITYEKNYKETDIRLPGFRRVTIRETETLRFFTRRHQAHRNQPTTKIWNIIRRLIGFLVDLVKDTITTLVVGRWIL